MFIGNQKGMHIFVIVRDRVNMKFVYSNSWSDEGVSTVRGDNGVECRATHLTSFAVLVDTQGSSTTSSTSIGLVITLKLLDTNVTAIIHFSLFLQSATLAVVYQYFHYFLQCLRSYTGGMYLCAYIYIHMVLCFATLDCNIIAKQKQPVAVKKGSAK